MTRPGPSGSDGAPAVDPAAARAARHGRWCPKMCTHACPVVAATGRDDAVPWSFHRSVDDLASGRRGPGGDLPLALEACTGCRACREPCLFDQDVPAQVRAGRAAAVDAGTADPAVDGAVARVRDGRSPFGGPVDAPPGTPAPAEADTALVVGCRDESSTAAAALRLLGAGGGAVAAVAPEGCCGAALRDLGATGPADARRDRIAHATAGADELVALDPHCLPSLRAARPGADVRALPPALAARVDDGRLALKGPPARVVYHDPCQLARPAGERAPVTDAPRRLLAAAGLEVVEPEGSGTGTVCSGAGMGMELLAPEAAGETAARRAEQLGRAAGVAVTACGGAARRLAAAGLDVRPLSVVLAGRIGEDRIGEDRRGPERIGEDRIGEDRIGEDRTSQDRTPRGRQ